MLAQNKIGPMDAERLNNHLNEIYAEALRVDLGGDLDQTGEQLKALAGAVARMDAYVRHLRGKWYPGCDDGPTIEYKPHYETRNAARVVQRGGGR